MPRSGEEKDEKRRKDTIDPRPGRDGTPPPTCNSDQKLKNCFFSGGGRRHFCLLAVFPARFHAYCSSPPCSNPLVLSFFPASSVTYHVARRRRPREPRHGEIPTVRQTTPAFIHPRCSDWLATRLAPGDGRAFNPGPTRRKPPVIFCASRSPRSRFFPPSQPPSPGGSASPSSPSSRRRTSGIPAAVSSLFPRLPG